MKRVPIPFREITVHNLSMVGVRRRNKRSIFETEIYACVYNDGFVYAHDCV